MSWIRIMVLIILQWNARSLIANGQEFKKYIDNLSEKPNIICVQETWLIPKIDFVIKYINKEGQRNRKRRGSYNLCTKRCPMQRNQQRERLRICPYRGMG